MRRMEAEALWCGAAVCVGERVVIIKKPKTTALNAEGERTFFHS